MTDTKILYQYRSELTTLCEQVASFIKEQLNQVKQTDIETKDENSLVSFVDKEAERMIVHSLSRLTPEAGFITEEDTEDERDKPLTWVIDPLDGTTNFLTGIPHFSISIALMENNETILGIVYEVMLDIAYTAIRGEGAWEGDKVIKLRSTSKLSEAIIVTGFPYRRGLNIDASLAVLKYCVINCRGIRRLGSAALDLAYVAAGKVDVYYENSLNIWDLAAGALLVTEAGGVVKEDYLRVGSIIAGNEAIAGPILEEIQRVHVVV